MRFSETVISDLFVIPQRSFFGEVPCYLVDLAYTTLSPVHRRNMFSVIYKDVFTRPVLRTTILFGRMAYLGDFFHAVLPDHFG